MKCMKYITLAKTMYQTANNVGLPELYTEMNSAYLKTEVNCGDMWISFVCTKFKSIERMRIFLWFIQSLHSVEIFDY